MSGCKRRNETVFRYTLWKTKNCWYIAFFLVLTVEAFILVDNWNYARVLLPLGVVVIGLVTIGLKRSAHVIIDSEGIKVISSECSRLLTIRWEEIDGCFFIKSPSYHSSSYLAFFRKQRVDTVELFLLRNNYPSSETILKYRFDEVVEQLNSNYGCNPNLDDLSIILLSVSEKEYSQVESIWNKGKLKNG